MFTSFVSLNVRRNSLKSNRTSQNGLSLHHTKRDKTLALFPRPDSSSSTEQLKSICPGCGEVVDRQLENGPWCESCKPKDDGAKDARRGNRHQRGYDNTWERLSKRARQLQPFCEDCGAEDDLTADHSEEAWRRREAGKVIRLQDIAVVCRRCNSERGAARGEKASDQWRLTIKKSLDD